MKCPHCQKEINIGSLLGAIKSPRRAQLPAGQGRMVQLQSRRGSGVLRQQSHRTTWLDVCQLPWYNADWMMRFTVTYFGSLELDCANSQVATIQARQLIPRGAAIKEVKGATLAEAGLEDTEEVLLTKELIDACRANGSFTNATLRAFGMRRSTMSVGWPGRLVGKKLTTWEYRTALDGRMIYNSGHLEK